MFVPFYIVISGVTVGYLVWFLQGLRQTRFAREELLANRESTFKRLNCKHNNVDTILCVDEASKKYYQNTCKTCGHSWDHYPPKRPKTRS